MLSVDDVVFRTRIPRSVVEALEAEDFSVFTSPTYAKSFLRQYSDFLKVDAEPWLDALVPASYVSGESWQPMFTGGEAALPVGKRAARDARQHEDEPASRSNQRSAIWLMLLTAGLVFGAVKGYQFLDRKFGGDEHPKHAATENAKDTAATAPEQTQENTESQNAPTTAGEQSSANHTAEPAKTEPADHPPRAVIVRE